MNLPVCSHTCTRGNFSLLPLSHTSGGCCTCIASRLLPSRAGDVDLADTVTAGNTPSARNGWLLARANPALSGIKYIVAVEMKT